MGKNRLEAFSDGVLAIIITIMVLEFKVPLGGDIEALRPLIPKFISYLLSFIYVGIYWNNHHHMFQAVKKVSGPSLWANLHLLFWLSVVPFTTSWMGENYTKPWPVAFYGFILLMAGTAYYILSQKLIRSHDKNSALAEAVGADVKGVVSLVIYAIAIPLSFVNPFISFVLYGVVAAIWFLPDRRIERVLTIREPSHHNEE